MVNGQWHAGYSRSEVKVLVVVLALLLAACDSGDAEPGPTTSAPTTTTTIDDDTCDRVGEDTVEYLEDLIDTLDETRLAELVDIESWGQDLRDLQRAGQDLDLRVTALRCDPVAIQQRAFREADMTPRGPLSGRLLTLLLSSEPTPTSTTATVETTTTTTGTTTTGG